MEIPETRYAKAFDGTHIAYQVVGEGPDLVYVPGWDSRVAASWDQPLDAKFLGSLADSWRLVLVDRRGSGLSDSVSHVVPPSLETRIDDIKIVLDAVGSERAAILGISEGGPLCALFAATYPARTSALVLYATWARGAWAPDYPWAWTDQQLEEDLARAEQALERGSDDGYFDEWLEETVPSLAHDARSRPWLRKVYASTGNPGSLIALARLEHELDIRAVLPTIQVPTLVINRTGDRVADLDEGRWLAGQIPGASFVELPGIDHPPWAGNQRLVLETISSFLGVRRPPADVDRTLATVLFTDIVGSTAKQAALGDGAWKELLESHHATVRDEIERWHGAEVDTAGDGFYATFEGPARAVRCALDIGGRVRELGLEIRAGVHVGECTLIDGKVGGLPVTIGARIAARAEASEVLVSQTVKDLVPGSGLTFEDAGEHELKGVPDRWHLYRVVSEST